MTTNEKHSTNTINIPKGILGNGEDAAARQRREIREQLLRGQAVKVAANGQVADTNDPAATSVIPKGILGNDEDAAARQRREIREQLLRGQAVKVAANGQVADTNDPAATSVIPKGILGNDEDAAARQRREIREQLLRGQAVKVAANGQVADTNDPAATSVIPKGKLASFYWYERNPQLLEAEKIAMRKTFPHFQLNKLDDNSLYWHGELQPLKGMKWYLMAIYDNNHPHNNNYGGSVKVYSVEPDLNELNNRLGPIPHLISGSSGVYMCTAQKQDVAHGNVVNGQQLVTSAASSLLWAVKWMTICEMWMLGEVSTAEFSNHTY